MTSQEMADELLAEYQRSRNDDEPRTHKEIAQSRIEHMTWELRQIISDLSSWRLDPVGAPLVANELYNLMECKTALDVLASHILEAADRKLASHILEAADRKRRIVHNG